MIQNIVATNVTVALIQEGKTINGVVVQLRTNISGQRDPSNAIRSLRLHWPEYLMEAGEVSLYMFCACAFGTLLQHPASPIRQAIMGGLFRRALMGLAIGATVIAIILSPWGKQSGGHFNPAVTLTFYRLGKVEPWDLLFYSTAQFSGAISGVVIANFVLLGAPGNNAVRFVVTMPGMYGSAVAFLAEAAISFGLMITILFVTNREVLARYTPYFVGALYAIYIAFEMPLSGMSMNPARTVGSAFSAGYWHALWIYFIAPTFGMMAAAEVFLRVRAVMALIVRSYTTLITNAAYSSTPNLSSAAPDFSSHRGEGRVSSITEVEGGWIGLQLDLEFVKSTQAKGPHNRPYRISCTGEHPVQIHRSADENQRCSLTTDIILMISFGRSSSALMDRKQRKSINPVRTKARLIACCQSRRTVRSVRNS